MECSRVERRELLVIDDPPHSLDEEILRQGDVCADRGGGPPFDLAAPVQGVRRGTRDELDHRLDCHLAAIGQDLSASAHTKAPCTYSRRAAISRSPHVPTPASPAGRPPGRYRPEGREHPRRSPPRPRV